MDTKKAPTMEGKEPSNANISFQQDKNNFLNSNELGENITTSVSGKSLIEMNVSTIHSLYGFFPIGISLVVGASDTGKSMILRQLAMVTSAGKDFLGRLFNGEHKSAIVVCTEDDAEAVSYLLKKQNQSLGVEIEDLSRLRFIFDSLDIPQKIEAELTASPADLIICDALGDLFNGKDLNQNSQVRQFLNQFTILANKFKVPIVFLHHTSKRSEDLAPSKNNSIGSQGIEAKARFVAELRQDKKNENIRNFCIVKGNYLPREMKTASYDLLMDYNLCFSDSGQRTDFENLAIGAQKAEKKVLQITDDEYISFLMGIYDNKDTFYTGRILTEKIMQRYSVADKTARGFISYFDMKKWIIDKSKAKSRKEFYLSYNGIMPKIW